MKAKNARRVTAILTKVQMRQHVAAYKFATKGPLGLEEELDQQRLDAIRHEFGLRPILRVYVQR